MIEFYKALYSHFTAEPHNTFYNAVGGRFSYGEGKQGGAYPYAVYFGMPVTNEDTFQEEIDGGSFQINIYSDNRSPSEVMQALQVCRALFDGVTLEIPGYRNVTLKREMATPPWKDGNEWVASIEFETLIQTEG
jgi:hypothetical protein